MPVRLEQILIEPSARAAIAGHTRSRPDHETGGILVGTRLDESNALITRASPPGPKARHGRFFFSRDSAFLQEYLDRVHDRSEGREDYLGEWHVHPALDAAPSCVDRRSLFRIARSSRYGTSDPLLIIAEHVPGTLRLRCYGFVVKPRREIVELGLQTSA